jgi:hypothetical protein
MQKKKKGGKKAVKIKDLSVKKAAGAVKGGAQRRVTAE